ncbi:choice-of-anchor J domain-containing protein [Micromonospora endolithica]|uniref:Peptidase M6 immune inhibitor A n=1 Tax=Micromonospora endolithica TaxID=230091 RepID=A0A3A9ZQ18_9ACTN|nr:choice-of-anchor J domain-containing protein [Micromonospora endolithica]RKN49577.1 peptidase M6 immune inhibitor A [Micromonospora endolithica]TWJ23800.1 immune inhibitor A peptidase M6 [Micromonospora endolithica]
MVRRRFAGIAAGAIVLPLLAVVAPSGTASANPSGAATPPATGVASDVRQLTRKDFTLNGKPVEVPAQYQARAQAKRSQAQAETPPVGTVRQWLALDDYNGEIYFKDYTLRGVGEHIEVWVANDTAFPAGDCRAQIPGSTDVTDAQVADLVNEFDTNMYPKSTAAFSTPPDRDGSNASVEGDFSGAGNKTVTLVDNVRDDNFYDFPAAPTYIAGFFFSLFNELLDRNIMTIDAFDWAHRTGANPPNEPTDDLCTSRPARPALYEGTFIHEWQHLAHYYTDPFESILINEGLSDFAQTLGGYVDATATVDEPGTDSHIYCFQGFGTVQTPYNTNPRDCGGPENSLNLWDEGNTSSGVLADYGNAYSLMLYLYDRYGLDFISKLHRDGDLQGLASLDAALEAEGVRDMYDVIHEYQTMNLVDRIVGSRFGIMLGADKRKVTTASLDATVNLANPASYETPGAAPNGADYVQLRKASGTPLKAHELRSIKFNGAKALPAVPLAWTTVTDDPDRPGNSVIWSGNGNSTDAAAVTPVTVPAADPTLTFLAKYGAETGYDYGYVSVSTDGGKSYTIIPGEQTVAGPLGPALNGTTDGFQPHSFDLSAYAGQSVLISFRYVSDGGVNEGGLLIDDIAVGGTLVSDGSSLAEFDSPTEISPTPVANWNVRFVGIDEKKKLAWQFEVDGKSSFTLGAAQTLILRAFPKVVAVVAYDEPTEQVTQYAPYSLKVNNVVQPGGAPLS